MSIVGLQQLRIQTIVGLLPFERIQPQEIWLNITMHVDFQQCNQDGRESLDYSVDYATVATDLTQWIQQEKFKLIESIALLGCQRILEKHPLVSKCTIEVHKPEAIEDAHSAWVAWTETRQTED